MYRYRMSRGKSKSQFRRGASQVHRLNSVSTGSTYVMRGGIRL